MKYYEFEDETFGKQKNHYEPILNRPKDISLLVDTGSESLHYVSTGWIPLFLSDSVSPTVRTWFTIGV